MAAIFYTLATLKSRINDKLADKERGATAVEYGIMVAAIAVLILATVFILGGQVRDLFGDVSTSIQNGGPAETD